MIRLILFGVCGRMGRITLDELDRVEDLTVVAGVERVDHPDVGSMFGSTTILADGSDLPEAEVWLDFSLAGPALKHAAQAALLGVPIVIAATGFNTDQMEELHRLSDRCPLMAAPNLSLGVAVLERVGRFAAEMLPSSFDASIMELHHSEKKDSPSGTAKRIAEILEQYRDKPQLLSLRAGGAIGEHQIRFVGNDEEIVLIHRAWSRKAFSSGIPDALRFIAGKPPGFYTPQDILSN